MQTLIVGSPQHRVHLVGRQFATAETQHLLKQRLTVTHRAGCPPGDQLQGLVIGINLLTDDDLSQPPNNLGDFNRREIKPLAPTEHRNGQLLGVGGTEDELHMLGRLFQRFQQRIEGCCGQHVNFVNDVNLVTSTTGADAHVRSQGTDFVNPAIAGPVDLDHVNVFTGINRLSDVIFVIKFSTRTARVIQRLGKDPRRAGLAHSSGTGKQVSMPDAPGFDRVGQRLTDVLLAHQLREIFWPITPCDHHIARIVTSERRIGGSSIWRGRRRLRRFVNHERSGNE